MLRLVCVFEVAASLTREGAAFATPLREMLWEALLVCPSSR